MIRIYSFRDPWAGKQDIVFSFELRTDFIVGSDSERLEFIRGIAFKSGRFGIDFNAFFFEIPKKLSKIISEEKD